MNSIPQCMGGWCRRREQCQHYHAPQRYGVPPIERICAPSDDRPVLRGTAQERMADVEAPITMMSFDSRGRFVGMRTVSLDEL